MLHQIKYDLNYIQHFRNKNSQQKINLWVHDSVTLYRLKFVNTINQGHTTSAFCVHVVSYLLS
jgi:hypothetical protein